MGVHTLRNILNAQEMQEFAETIVLDVVPHDTATVVTLSGELGAGKTTFVQGVAHALGVEETVASPTYVIEKVYALTDQKFSHLVHIDAYRLKGADELAMLGWDELVSEPGNLVLLEWPEKVSALIPETAIRLRIDIDGDGRIITRNDGKESEEG